MRKPEKKPPIPQTSDQVASADWVKDMRSFHSRYGFYRPQDLGRVLGNPLDAVESGNPADLHFASKISEK